MGLYPYVIHTSLAVSRARVRRGYNNNNGGYGGYGTGYGTGYGGSDERDASVSSDGCNSGEDTRRYRDLGCLVP